MNLCSFILLAKMGEKKHIRYEQIILWKMHRFTDSRLLKISIEEVSREY